MALQKDFAIDGTAQDHVSEWKLIICSTIQILAFRANTQSPLTLGGNGDAVFKDAAGDFADNAAKYSLPSEPDARFNWTHGLLSERRAPQVEN